MLLVLLILITPLAVFGFIKWREGGINGGQKYAKPFRIAGNLYYVGANDISSFLITGPDPGGYRAYIDSAEAQFRRGVVH